jgi:hypothetical protein
MRSIITCEELSLVEKIKLLLWNAFVTSRLFLDEKNLISNFNMRIHLTGTNWQGATTYNIERVLRSLGHEVLFFDEHSQGIDRILEGVKM